MMQCYVLVYGADSAVVRSQAGGRQDEKMMQVYQVVMGGDKVAKDST